MDTQLAREQVEQIVKSAREKGQRPNLGEANLSRVDLHKMNLSGARLFGADLREANLSGADLSRAFLFEADLREANLSRARLFDVYLCEGNLSGAFLGGAFLGGANLSWADLRKANLSGANLVEVNFFEADLREANLSGARLSRANFTRANLSQTNLSKTRVLYTIFGDVDLREVKGLETAIHEGPSTIGIDTIYRSRGDISSIFLEKAGVPPEFIAYLEKIKFPKCLYTQEQVDSWISNLQKRLTIISKKLAHHQNQAAGFGALNAPFPIIYEIDNAKEELEEVEAELAKWQQLKDIYYSF